MDIYHLHRGKAAWLILKAISGTSEAGDLSSYEVQSLSSRFPGSKPR